MNRKTWLQHIANKAFKCTFFAIMFALMLGIGNISGASSHSSYHHNSELSYLQNLKKIEAPAHHSWSLERIQLLKEPEKKENTDDKDSDVDANFVFVLVSHLFSHLDSPQHYEHYADSGLLVKKEIPLFLLFHSWKIYS